VSVVTPWAECTVTEFKRDVLAQIAAVEDDPGVVGESFGRNAIGVRVDGDDAPAIAVAHLIYRVPHAVSGTRSHGDGGVVASADDEVQRAIVVSVTAESGIEPNTGSMSRLTKVR
jgi:hypothetical protein